MCHVGDDGDGDSHGGTTSTNFDPLYTMPPRLSVLYVTVLYMLSISLKSAVA